MSKVYRSSDFFRALSPHLRAHLPQKRRKFNTRLRNWMLQVYFGEFAVHYEASAYQRQNLFEIGLHFERRGRERNDALMGHFMPFCIEIKAELGAGVEFERWDKGWSKIYQTVPLLPYDEAYLEHVAKTLASMIECLQPIVETFKD